MNKKTFNIIHGHTYESSIINKTGWVLDLGCNDFIVTKHFLDLGLKVISLDPIKEINIPSELLKDPNFYFLNKACVGTKTDSIMLYYEYQAWGANSLYNTPEKLHKMIDGKSIHGHGNNPLKNKYYVELTTIKQLMEEFEISQFELIKMDVEGAEYDILENLPENCSKQISVEFHDFLKLNPMEDEILYHRLLDEKLNMYNRYTNESNSSLDDVLFLLK